jgi:hypothetical protein
LTFYPSDSRGDSNCYASLHSTTTTTTQFSPNGATGASATLTLDQLFTVGYGTFAAGQNQTPSPGWAQSQTGGWVASMQFLVPAAYPAALNASGATFGTGLNCLSPPAAADAILPFPPAAPATTASISSWYYAPTLAAARTVSVTHSVTPTVESKANPAAYATAEQADPVVTLTGLHVGTTLSTADALTVTTNAHYNATIRESLGVTTPQVELTSLGLQADIIRASSCTAQLDAGAVPCTIAEAQLAPTFQATPPSGYTCGGTACDPGILCVLDRCQGHALATGVLRPIDVDVGSDKTVYFLQAASDAYSSDGALLAVPDSGGTPRKLATGQLAPTSVRVAGTSVVWTNAGNDAVLGTVNVVGTAGGTITTLATNQYQAGGLSIFNDSSRGYISYWTTSAYDSLSPLDARLGACALSGGALSMLYDGGLDAMLSGSVVSPDGRWVLFAETVSGSIVRAARVPGDAAASTVLASGRSSLSSIDVDPEGHVYFSDDAGLETLPIAGGTVVTLSPAAGLDNVHYYEEPAGDAGTKHYVVFRTPDHTALVAHDVDMGTETLLTQGWTDLEGVRVRADLGRVYFTDATLGIVGYATLP